MINAAKQTILDPALTLRRMLHVAISELESKPDEIRHLMACLQGGRITLASRLTRLEGTQKIAWVYKKNFTATVTLQPGTL